MADRARCPSCRNTNALSLTEIHDEIGTTDFGEIRYDRYGALVPPGDFWFQGGEPHRSSYSLWKLWPRMDTKRACCER